MFGNHLASKVAETENSLIKVSFISTTETELRGFSGINEIFLNENAFISKMLSCDSRINKRPGLLDKVAKLAISSIAIHEMSHTRIRQVNNLCK